MRLPGKVAIVTGAARGIGLATAIRFAEEGARVVLCDVEESTGHLAGAEVKKFSPASFFVKLDVTDRTAVEWLVQKVVHEFSQIDILINNAGVTADAQLLKMTADQWDRVI